MIKSSLLPPLFLILFFLSVFCLLVSFVIWPEMDLYVSGLFAIPGQGFIWRESWFLLALNDLAVYGSRGLGVVFFCFVLWSWASKSSKGGLSAKAWLFLFVALVVGPGLIANVVFKDHWGRARPREITEFGGKAQFTPATMMTDQCRKNCSFVAGDGAFGFYLPIFAYLVLPQRRRKVFWSLLGVGTLFASARLVLGAHFLSDILYAAFFMFLSNALLHGLFFGKQNTLSFWKDMIKDGFSFVNKPKE